MSQTRRHFTPEKKAAIVRRHLAGKEQVSDLADEFRLQPSQSEALHRCRSPISAPSTGRLLLMVTSPLGQSPSG